MSGSIKFYILMPVYNVEPFVEESIRSALSQTYSNFSLIAVDDGSPDKSGEICDAFAAQDSRVTVVHQENKGLILARRRAIEEAVRLYGAEEASSAYAVFLDSDDWLEPNALEVIAGKLSADPSDCLVYGYQIVRNGEIVYKTPPETKCNSYEEACRRICKDTCYNSLCRKAIRLDIVSQIDSSQFAHIRLGEDCLQTLEVLRRARVINFTSEHLYNYRENPNSMTHDVNYNKFDFSYTVPKEVFRFLQETALDSKETLEIQKGVLSRRVFNDVLKLLFSGYSKKEKRLWLKKIRSSPFLLETLYSCVSYAGFSKKETLLMRLFVARQYSLLFLYAAISKKRNGL